MVMVVIIIIMLIIPLLIVAMAALLCVVPEFTASWSMPSAVISAFQGHCIFPAP